MRHVIVDGTNLFTIHYTANPATDNNGNPIGGVKGFLNALKNIIVLLKPQMITVVFDGAKGSVQKRKLYSEYKEGRKPKTIAGRYYEYDTEEQAAKNKQWQQAELINLLDMLPVCVLITQSCEADDAIAYLINNLDYLGGEDSSVLLVSCDKDFYQLINDKVVIYNPMSKALISINDILTEYNIHPKNWAVAKSIVGDNSDNIDGIKGIGFKTCAKLFDLYDKEVSVEHIENIVKNFDDNKSSKKKKYDLIKENFQVVERNYQLVNLKDPMMSMEEKDRITIRLSKFLPVFKLKDVYIKITQMSLGYDYSFLTVFNKLLRPVELNKK